MLTMGAIQKMVLLMTTLVSIKANIPQREYAAAQVMVPRVQPLVRALTRLIGGIMRMQKPSAPQMV